jgi:hypothetical protein
MCRITCIESECALCIFSSSDLALRSNRRLRRRPAGRLEHIQSGTTARLACLDDLTTFILECFSSVPADENQNPNEDGAWGKSL